MTMLACMESGVPYVPMRANYPENRILQIKKETGFELLLTQDECDKLISLNENEYIEPDHTKMDTLYTICTSGSTGKPKAVIVSRTSITDFWNWCNQYFKNIHSNDNIPQVDDFTFDI